MEKRFTFKMESWYNVIHDLKFILSCTMEFLDLGTLVLLLTGATAFLLGWNREIACGKTAKRCLLPLAAIESGLFLTMIPYLIRWVRIGSFTWGFHYEGGFSFYLPFTAMIGVLIGYLSGIALARRKA